MHLLSLIIGMMLIGYILFNAIRNQRLKKNAKSEIFEEIILEKTQDQFHQIHKKLPEAKREHDPLLEDYAKEALNKAPLTLKTEVLAQEQELEEPEEADELSVAKLPDYQEEKENIYKAQLSEEQKDPDFIAITILPKQSTYFSGKALIGAFHKYHFQFGKQNLYHRHFGDDPSKAILYSITSIVEPGYFEQATMLKTSFPGFILFMLPSWEVDPANIFEKMLTNARQLAATLNAELCDIKRNPLTTQTLTQIRDKIKERSIHAAMRGQQSW